jgi:hypothetical protein
MFVRSTLGLALIFAATGCGTQQPQKEAPKKVVAPRVVEGSTVTSTTSGSTVYASQKGNYAQRCQERDGQGCRNLSTLYEKGLGVKKNLKKSLTLVEKGCDYGNGSSCNRAGNFYDYGYAGVSNKQTAASYYKKGCDLNYGIACNNIGNAYISGSGVVKNVGLAETYLNKAISLGENAYANLGFVYRLKGDDNKAIAYYKKGCDLKDATACGNLAYVYKEQKKYTKAYNYYLQSCNLADGSACHIASMMIYRKQVTPANPTLTSYKLDMNSCELNNKVGCSDVAYDYEKGLGVTKDLKKAKFYYAKACRLGHKASCKR